ncbi:MAG: hypothetical protein LBS50_11125 [Prevotellaceae bacterium]|jgi:hypothetical protein|nr:hypothetical protein [Prevotellaceae bacterium]
MKKIILITLMFLWGNLTYSQIIYYGFPDTNSQLIKNTILIVNLFNDYNMDSRIEGEDSKIDTLCAILNNNHHLYFDIEINIFDGSKEFCLAFSQKTGKNLDAILQEKVKNCNYTIKGNGNTNPIFCLNDKKYYEIYNDRIDIFITEKIPAAADLQSAPSR